ncbi:SDR family oxidoreductase [Halobacteriaceae archaeon GCM10025711]
MDDETVLITGCSTGIGRATAKAFLDDDWTVYATARDEDDVADLADLGCETAALDVTDPGQIDAVVDRMVEEQGRIDCLVNNAGYSQPGAVEDVSTRRLHRQFDVNVYGPHRLVRAVLPHMRRQERGTIVNLSSVVGRIAVPGLGAYSASKFAVEALSDALRNEVAEFDVDVVVVEPGPVDTQFEERANGELADIDRSPAYDRLYEFFDEGDAVSAAFASTPGEVAAVVLNAASCTDPAPRYPVGTVGKAAGLVRHLPDRWFDLGLRLLSKLAR